jgi:hypothetical protein
MTVFLTLQLVEIEAGRLATDYTVIGGDQIEGLLPIGRGLGGESEGGLAAARAPGPHRFAHDGGEKGEQSREVVAGVRPASVRVYTLASAA